LKYPEHISHHFGHEFMLKCLISLSLLQYAFNIFSHNAPVLENGYNEEEMKMVKETRKIWVSLCEPIGLNSFLLSLHYSPKLSLIVII
jgi:aspartate-semialdehyde dehydrogenase